LSAIDVENVKIGDTTYTIDALFTRTVSISDDLNDEWLLKWWKRCTRFTVIVYAFADWSKAGMSISITQIMVSLIVYQPNLEIFLLAAFLYS